MKYTMDPHQYTLKKTVDCHGIGLHSGRDISLRIKPAAADTGIRFFRSDLPGQAPVYAHMNRVVDTNLATTIGNQYFRISTTEHLMAALRASGIDNADIAVNAPEIPIMDGSAAPFVEALKRAGTKQQNRCRRVLKITRPISYTDGDKHITISPYDGFKVSGEIAFDAEIIKHQKYTFDLNSGHFDADIARARTFGYVEEVEQLWANGLAQGGNLANVIAIHWDRKSILNEDGLRYKDEFVRHKILDLIGDIALLGIPVLGHIEAYKVGHTQHLGLMKAIEEAEDCWEVVELKINGGQSVLSRMAASTRAIGTTMLPFFHTEEEPTALAA
ncbi:MAG: UDP-3-O-acyl-N-acetylglucosamine deacetylase [Desulforhopalus sp.]|nr:UDP-3-O-acyl-N-acetylglucosamine deacetylase [Desulforhopalus sp.]